MTSYMHQYIKNHPLFITSHEFTHYQQSKKNLLGTGHGKGTRAVGGKGCSYMAERMEEVAAGLREAAPAAGRARWRDGGPCCSGGAGR